MRARPPQSATSRHYAEPIQATGGDYDELDGDYDLAGRDSNDVDEGYVHRVRPRRTSDMSISVQGPAAPQRTPAPPYVVSRDTASGRATTRSRGRRPFRGRSSRTRRPSTAGSKLKLEGPRRRASRPSARTPLTSLPSIQDA